MCGFDNACGVTLPQPLLVDFMLSLAQKASPELSFCTKGGSGNILIIHVNGWYLYCRCFSLAAKSFSPVVSHSVVPYMLCFLGGDGAEVRLHPAELLDDPVPETPGCQAAISAHAGTELCMEDSKEHVYYLKILS